MIHILNGDALYERFPKNIQGELVVMRECLIDGDLEGNTLEEFAHTRELYLSKTYPEVKDVNYSTHVLPELKRIKSIPDEAEISLWFEDDLFCQVNLWFVCHLMLRDNQVNTVHLVRPDKLTQWGFAAYSEEGLNELFEKRISLNSEHLSHFVDLWNAYKDRNVEDILKVSKRLEADLPWISTPVNALVHLINEQKPQNYIKSLIAENSGSSFGEIFGIFTREMPEYGFGDLQVKRIYDELT